MDLVSGGRAPNLVISERRRGRQHGFDRILRQAEAGITVHCFVPGSPDERRRRRQLRRLAERVRDGTR